MVCLELWIYNLKIKHSTTQLKTVKKYWSYGWILRLDNCLDDCYIINRCGSLYEKNMHTWQKDIYILFAIWKGKEFLVGCMISLDCQKRWTLLRHAINDAINEELSHSSKKNIFNFGRACESSKWPATRLPILFHTCAIQFMSVEYVGHSICTISSWKRKSSSKLALCGLHL